MKLRTVFLTLGQKNIFVLASIPSATSPPSSQVLSESGIAYDAPLNPGQVAANLAERIARAKQKSQQAAQQAAELAQQQKFLQQQQQQQQQQNLQAQVRLAVGEAREVEG